MNCRELIEQSILRTLLTDYKQWLKKTISSRDFKIPIHRKIFEAMEDQDSKEGLVNFLGTALRVKNFGLTTINNIVDREYCSQDLFTINTNERYLREINKETLVADIINEVGNEPSQVEAELSKRLAEINREAEKPENLFNEIYKEMEQLSSNPDTMLGIKTGYEELDNRTYGLKPGELWIIAARPSMGKSVFALNIAYNTALQGKHVYIQALEETKKNITKRLMSRITGIELHRIMSGRLKSEEWPAITASYKTIDDLKITIDDTSGLKSADIANRIRSCNSKRKIDLVIIDHIQEVYDKEQNRHLAISSALNTFKSTTKNMGIPLIVISQINRAVEARKENRPFLGDLKESGDIEAKADNVLMLYRDDYYSKTNTGIMEVLLAKARNGITGTFNLTFNGSRMTIS